MRLGGQLRGWRRLPRPMAITRRSSSASGSGQWGRAIRCPDWAQGPKSFLCRALRRVTAPPAGITPTGHAGVRGQRAEWPVGPGNGSAWPRSPEQGRRGLRLRRCQWRRRAIARPAGTTWTRERPAMSRGFVASERNGRWGRATKVPGLDALNKGGSGRGRCRCRAPRRAVARPAGTTRDGRNNGQGFVVSEKNGRWGQAIEVPGLGALNNGRPGHRLVGVVRFGG